MLFMTSLFIGRWYSTEDRSRTRLETLHTSKIFILVTVIDLFKTVQNSTGTDAVTPTANYRAEKVALWTWLLPKLAGWF